MGKHALAALAIVLGGSVAAAKDLVVYRVIEELETPAYPVSRSEALVDELKTMIEARERGAMNELGRLDDVQPLSAITYGGGKNRYDVDDPEVFTKSLGEQRVAPESTGFGGWVARQLGLGTSAEDTLPTFEEHMTGVAKVESSFIAPRGQAPRTFNGRPVSQSADRVAVQIHAEANGKTYTSRPIHLTVEELRELARDPEAALKSPAGALIRSVYREDIVGVGHEDHTGIEPVVLVHAVTGPGRLGVGLATLPESILDRTRKHESLSRAETSRRLSDRRNRQFLRERMEAIHRSLAEAARAAREALVKDRPAPPSSGRGKPGTIHDKMFTVTSPSGITRDVYAINDGRGGWQVIVTRPGVPPRATMNEAYRPADHGAPPAVASTEGARSKIEGLLGD